MEYDTENVVGFDGPRKAPTLDDYKAVVDVLEELLVKAKNEEILGLAYAYITGPEIGGRSVHTNWLCLPGTNKHVMVSSVRYLEHDLLTAAVERHSEFE